MITQPEGFLRPDLLVEGAHWLVWICIYFNRAVVNLREGLNLNIVAPSCILSLFGNIRFHVLNVTSNNEVFEVVFLMQNVVHALQADHSVLILVAICLMSNWSEQAVPIPANLDNPEVFGLKVLPEPSLLLLPIDGIEVKLWALWLFRVEFDAPALTAAHLLWRLILF